METTSHPQVGRVLRLVDVLPNLLSISGRVPCIARTLRSLLRFTDDTRLSLGACLEHNADRHPDKPAILYEDVTYTHRAFNQLVNRYAHSLASIGVERGDDVAVLLDNRPELLMIIGALSKLGAASALINPNQRGDVLLHSINLARGRHFIVGEELLDAFRAIQDDLDLGRSDTLCYLPDRAAGPAPEGYLDLSGTLEQQSTDNPPSTAEVTLGERFGYVYTSGTTGLPKASIQTHRRWFSAQYWYGKIVMDLGPTDILYCPIPLYHTNGLHLAWGSAAGGAAALAIRRKFSASGFLDDVRRFDANCFVYIGEICRYLLNQPARPDDADNPLVFCVGNGLRPDIWDAFKRRFGIEKVYELYGAAEGTFIFTNLLNLDHTAGTCLTPYAVVRYDVDEDEPVRDETGFLQRVEKGEVGLLIGQIKQNLPFAGYTSREETERKVLRDVFEPGDRWFDSGDLVLDQGFRHIQFVDRIGDTFRWKGENVSTTEVERAINALDQVAECTVYGVAVPQADGRAGMAAIIPAIPPDEFDLKVLAAHVLDALPPYAVPRFIRLEEEFETTATHKIRKVVLRSQGFEPARVSGPLFFLDPGQGSYVPLTEPLYREIVAGRYRF